MLIRSIRIACLWTLCVTGHVAGQAVPIPLPEHPRPDFQRSAWQNLNGTWQFQFDANNVGIDEKWFTDVKSFGSEITVPFPWGSALSGVPDEADIGWYSRNITVPQSSEGQRVFLVVGASDWRTTAWLPASRAS